MKQIVCSSDARNRVFLAFAAAVVFGMATGGRAESADGAAWPVMRPLGQDIPATRGEAGQTSTGPVRSPVEPEEPLTLRRALELALAHSPDLAANAQTVRAAEGAARQAGVLPNPELEIEAEEFGGSDARKGYDAAQTTARISQPVELGGKRTKRRNVALAEARLWGWDYEAARLDVLTRTKQAFVDVLTAQEQLALTEGASRLAEDVRKAVAERVQAGKVPELEETKAAVEVAAAGIARDRAKRNLDVARTMLAANWGGEKARFPAAVGALDTIRDLVPVDALSAALAQAPEVARWTDRRAAAQETLALAKAMRVPDIALSAGISRFEEDGTHSAVAGLSLPLPLFDRNAGGIAAAQHEALAVEQHQRAARLRAATELATAYGRLESARAEAVATRTGLLPAAQQAFDAAQAGYRQGKFGYLDVLDAQRTLNEAKTTLLDALAAYHKAEADVERITGTSYETIR